MAAILGSIMPEEHEGENIYISECLCGVRKEAGVMERLKVALFLVSNNFLLDNQNESLPGHHARSNPRDTQPIDKIENQVNSADKIILAIFYLSRLNTVKGIKSLLSIPGPTAHAISLRLWASAVRNHNIKTIQKALKAGISPNTEVLFDNFPEKPLIIAAQAENPSVALEMTRLLLTHNACSHDPNALELSLYHATKRNNLELVNLFLLEGVHVPGIALEVAIESANSSLLETLLAADCDVDQRCGNYMTTGYSILGLAVKNNDAPLTRRLLAMGAKVDAHQEVLLEDEIFFPEEGDGLGLRSTTLGLAAIKANPPIIDLLLAAGANVNHRTVECDYIPPLVLAVANGHRNLTRRLLQAGADVTIGDATQEMTLVQRALAKNHLEISRILMSSGANVDGKLMQDYYTSRLMQKVKEDDLEATTLLVSWGARVNDTYDEIPDTVLGAAVGNGNCAILEDLLRAGGANIGKKLVSIGNLETAEYLEHQGLLQEVLLSNGQPILVSAIRCQAGELVQFLLDRGVG